MVAPTIRELLARCGTPDVVGIDIPIGFPDDGRRAADVLARAEVGRLWSSVFLMPVRAALLAASHAEAVRVQRVATGEGLSIQVYGLRPKILQVDELLRAGTVQPVLEVHPEVSFAAMAGTPLSVRKSTWAGAEQRRSLLVREGIDLPTDLGDAGRHAGIDDVLDAAAVAWTARRYAAGAARCLPDPPQVFSDGLAAAIWV